MIGDDTDDIAVEFSRAPPLQDIHHAMTGLGSQQRDTGTVFGTAHHQQGPCQTEQVSHARTESSIQINLGQVNTIGHHLIAHEEMAGQWGGELCGRHNGGTEVRQMTAHLRDDAPSIRTGQHDPESS